MCGIVGAYKPQGAVSSDGIVAAMRDSMVHRGPDGAGLWREPRQRCVMGHRRLSIIDLSTTAAQPMANADATVVIVFNGEIYNHAALRAELQALGRYQWKTHHSDTEVLLHAYEEWGLDCLQRLYGMFGFAVFDARDQERPVLHLVRDRMGVKPVYLTRTGSGEWLFASEIKALLAHPEVAAEMDRTALWHYLTFIVAPAPLTMFRDVFKLPNGSVVSIDHQGHAKSHRWYLSVPSKAQSLTEADLSYDDACGHLLGLLRQSVARRMVSDVPFGVLLSGGVDSSLNVALMSEQMDRPVSSFSIAYEDYEQYNELKFARRVAQRYGTLHHERVIGANDVLNFLPQLAYWQEEPIADNVCIPLYFLSELVRQNDTTVVQVGEGADEHFLGYWWCEHYRAKYESCYQPALRGRPSGAGWKRLMSWLPLSRRVAARLCSEDLEFIRRAQAGEPMFWGGATCFVGAVRDRLTPDRTAFRQKIDCPVDGMLPLALAGLDSAAVCQSHYDDLGELTEPAVLQSISFLESRMRLPEHLLMRVDKMTMAHSIEARVPFLDHDVVEFASRLPLSYKLAGGIGKRILKTVAEPFVDHDLLYRTKQGFGAPVDRWFAMPEFRRRVDAAFARSSLFKDGLFDMDVVNAEVRACSEGRSGNSFQVFALLNLVLWHAHWIEKQSECF